MDKKWRILNGLLISSIGVACYRYFFPKISLKTYTNLCLSFAIMDDEIARNELGGNFVGGKEIIFPPKEQSINNRYRMFLQMYKKYSSKELEQEQENFSKRLEESRRYTNEPKQKLELIKEKIGSS